MFALSLFIPLQFLTQYTALHLAAMFDRSGSGVRALIEAGAEINALQSTQVSPLHIAAGWNPAAVPILLAANAEVNISDWVNNSPLFYAAMQNQPESVAALCKAGADPRSLVANSLAVKKEMRTLIKSLSN